MKGIDMRLKTVTLIALTGLYFALLVHLDGCRRYTPQSNDEEEREDFKNMLRGYAYKTLK